LFINWLFRPDVNNSTCLADGIKLELFGFLVQKNRRRFVVIFQRVDGDDSLPVQGKSGDKNS